MDEFAERILNYLDKAEAALDAGETDKATAYTTMAKIATEIVGMPGGSRVVRAARDAGGRGRPGIPPTEQIPPDGP